VGPELSVLVLRWSALGPQPIKVISLLCGSRQTEPWA
jgi:hypothetical protein